jgi:outer membrane protein assembly factor BamB
MNLTGTRAVPVFSLRLVAAAAAVAAVCGAADWLTFAGDPQRTGWARAETKLSRENVARLKLEWSLKLDANAVELTSLTVPVIMENVITPRGFKDLVVVAGADDKVFAIDADTGKLVWTTHFTAEGSPKGTPHWLCPFSLNATPVIDRKTATVHVLASDGKLHSLNIVNGEDRVAPTQFTPPFAKVWSLNLLNGVLYTPTSQGCNGVRSAVYAMNLADPKRPVAVFQASPTGGAGIWGRAGVAVSPSGMVFAETGDGPYDQAAGKMSDTVLGLSPKDLKLADFYTPANRAWITKKDLDMGCISPVVFPFKRWELVAAAGKEGVIYLLDTKSMGGADHRVPLFRSPLWTNEDVDFAGRGFWGSLSTWEDPAGVRWLIAPAHGPAVAANGPRFDHSYGPTPNGSIMAFRVEERDGKPVLVPAWNSRDMSVPEPPLIANGVLFALSNGESARQVDSAGHLYTSKERIALHTGNATLYALDAATGKEIYSSASTIPGFTHFSGLAISGGRLYVVTHEARVYAFGLGE